jgi:hypothetical protein
MSFRDRRVRRSMTDPVRGTFTKVSDYFPHPGRTPMQTMLTGYVEAPGVPRTSTELLASSNRNWADAATIPVLVDRADPSRCVALWEELPRFDGGASAARAAARNAAQED